MSAKDSFGVSTEGIPDNIYAVRYLKDRLGEMDLLNSGSCFPRVVLSAAEEPFQGYSLSYRDNEIRISACGPEGFLYGCVELSNRIKHFGSNPESIFGHTSEIRECPKLSKRGFYHDAARGRVQTLESYKAMADMMVELKLNELQLYVEHSFRFSFLEEVWKDNTPLTADDIKELDAYCRERCIDLVPSLSTFGHFYTILRTREYAHLCELPGMENDRFSFVQRMQHHTLDVTNPESIQLVERMLKEFMPLFSSKYVNICADETFDLGKGRSKQYVEEVGEAEAYVGFLKKIMKTVTDAGKTPMFWGDILASFPEYAKELPKGVICLNWGYSEHESEDRVSAFAEQKLLQYLCPGVHGWNHSINRLDTAYGNISLMCGYALKYGAAGLLITDWGDYGHYNDPSFSVPGMAYGAYMGWSGNNIYTEAEMDNKISLEIYGDRSGRLVGLMKELASCEAAAWGNFVAIKEKIEGISDAPWQLVKTGAETAAAQNKKSKELCAEISILAGKVNSRGKTLIRRLLLFASGQRIINSICAEMSAQLFPENNSENERLPEEKVRASEIRAYISEYRKNWLETSRESELKRIEEVFEWYAQGCS